MRDRRREDRLYTAIVLAFLVGLVGLGLLGVPALLVAAIGVVVAAILITLCHGYFGDGRRSASPTGGRPARVPAKYVPSVLEGSSMRRRRLPGLRRQRHPNPPLRFR